MIYFASQNVNVIFLSEKYDGTGRLIGKGLLHLDAEVVNWFSSAYKCTIESQVATKKSHKTKKTDGSSVGFQHIYNKFSEN